MQATVNMHVIAMMRTCRRTCSLSTAAVAVVALVLACQFALFRRGHEGWARTGIPDESLTILALSQTKLPPVLPSVAPFHARTEFPTDAPSAAPTASRTDSPTDSPMDAPSAAPSVTPHRVLPALCTGSPGSRDCLPQLLQYVGTVGSFETVGSGGASPATLTYTAIEPLPERVADSVGANRTCPFAQLLQQPKTNGHTRHAGGDAAPRVQDVQLPWPHVHSASNRHQFRRLTARDMRTALTGKIIAFSGDSTVQNMFGGLFDDVLGTTWWPRWGNQHHLAKMQAERLRSSTYGDRIESLSVTTNGSRGEFLSNNTVGVPNVTIWTGNPETTITAGADVYVLNMHGLWSLLDRKFAFKPGNQTRSLRTWAEVETAATQRAKDHMKNLCCALQTPAALARSSPILVLWTLTNAIADDKLHTDPTREQPWMYERYCRDINVLEMGVVAQVLKENPGCAALDNIVFVDMHSLTLPYPECVGGKGDGRHYYKLQPMVWQWFVNAIIHVGQARDSARSVLNQS
jgi:hypothetical protein